MAFRFTRVVFGISASPVLLNATIKHHMEKYRDVDLEFVKLFTKSVLYIMLMMLLMVLVMMTLHMSPKKVLVEGGFNLQKFVNNSQSLQRYTEASEACSMADGSSLNYCVV